MKPLLTSKGLAAVPRRPCGASLPCGYAMLLLRRKGVIAVAEGNLGIAWQG
ncbi:hypothetical protein [Paenibacillus brasilensis]|uniref:hypothetical protein n=1 Tax=Paenibacillus brasilensis TaxID=128574 RepID=UPI00142ED30B|nr:hypothetical protein [Paenibacillus brasilensis]